MGAIVGAIAIDADEKGPPSRASIFGRHGRPTMAAVGAGRSSVQQLTMSNGTVGAGQQKWTKSVPSVPSIRNRRTHFLSPPPFFVELQARDHRRLGTSARPAHGGDVVQHSRAGVSSPLRAAVTLRPGARASGQGTPAGSGSALIPASHGEPGRFA